LQSALRSTGFGGPVQKARAKQPPNPRMQPTGQTGQSALAGSHGGSVVEPGSTQLAARPVPNEHHHGEHCGREWRQEAKEVVDPISLRRPTLLMRLYARIVEVRTS
jgi:hypothetical protein